MEKEFTRRHRDTEVLNMNENEIGSIIVDTAIDLHKRLGPGLLESVYEIIFTKLLAKRGLLVQRQVSIPIEFDGESFDEGFRIDLFVHGKVIIELKSVERITGIHKKQLLTYLKLTNTKVGYLLNFGAEVMKYGIYRVINGIVE
ncbi:MAG: GxxExxY protein [Treponema sp.]|nr:GxxExxY protein [Treponema sp.]